MMHRWSMKSRNQCVNFWRIKPRATGMAKASTRTGQEEGSGVTKLRDTKPTSANGDKDEAEYSHGDMDGFGNDGQSVGIKCDIVEAQIAGIAARGRGPAGERPDNGQNLSGC